jgi:hypothetical protein
MIGVSIAYAPKGEKFVDANLRKLWSSHPAKSKLVHDFLVKERYWFGVEQPHHELLDRPVEEYVTTLEAWGKRRQHIQATRILR